ncbi:hypothetical protein C7447_101874 [Tenacibaculum adriaticum]|uniref:Uncharacterized protein n=1 Tax=Tenacibaculum adriaticum TaxID=413713 RepID=A0A5S5DWG5_9FLAO|nr:hypothetical protein [Tenacibaculum adriaticum]TYQ00264.1 hypothetical protein C7447_101874 [Tenacibaculum adriaticum]
MENISIFLAKFWGWYMIIFFLILSLNPTRIKQIFDDLKDQKFVIISSFIAIIIGLLNILSHNIWADNWTIIVTLLGYASLFIGLSLFVFPVKTIDWMSVINVKFIQLLYLLLFLLGVFLLNMAYGVVPA